MTYYVFDRSSMGDSDERDPIARLFIEVNGAGLVMREVGVDEAGCVIHRSPDALFKHGTYGLLDNVRIELEPDRAIARDEFERAWGAKNKS